eukprot:UN00736
MRSVIQTGVQKIQKIFDCIGDSLVWGSNDNYTFKDNNGELFFGEMCSHLVLTIFLIIGHHSLLVCLHSYRPFQLFMYRS